MRHRIRLGLLTACTLMLLPALSWGADAPHIGEGGVPQFEYDKSWPKIPAAWKAGGAVTAISSDAQGNIWLLTRPKFHPASTPKETIPPAVLQFDVNGNFVQGWGGTSGPGYTWPQNEHGMSVDSKGFVWIVGNHDNTTANPDNAAKDKSSRPPNDSQVLKFTKDGKFVLAIGKPGVVGSNKTDVLRGATTPYYYQKANELFVTDGYGNARVIVYDADSGKMKRMWGAYGKPPLDQADRPPASKPSANPWVSVAERLQQFQSPVHDIKISDDDLVYVADRGNKRVQVFTLDGKFIGEQFVGINSTYGLQARSIAFSPDQRFLYVGGSEGTYILNRRTLEVLGMAVLGEGSLDHPAGHNVGTDSAGNLYLVQVVTDGLDGKNPGSMGVVKMTFKGYSPATKK
jgi:hypothetical protein